LGYKNKLDKSILLKNYLYKNIIMDNYGDPIYNKNNHLIGYKLNYSEYASILTYYNENNLLCNEVSIREFNEVKLSFEGNILMS
jgi:hypothetical protein